jgi:hypothetical protein
MIKAKNKKQWIARLFKWFLIIMIQILLINTDVIILHDKLYV